MSLVQRPVASGPGDDLEAGRELAGTDVTPAAALTRLERQIGHLDFLKMRLHDLLRDAGRNDGATRARLAEQLACAKAQLASLQVEQDRLLCTAGPMRSW
jgi:hypothetical protein